MKIERGDLSVEFDLNEQSDNWIKGALQDILVEAKRRDLDLTPFAGALAVEGSMQNAETSAEAPEPITEEPPAE